MDHHHHAVVERRQQPFGAAVQPLDPPAFQAPGEIVWEGPAQIGAALQDPADAPSRERGHKAAADGLDFGEFGHGGDYGKPGPGALWSLRMNDPSPPETAAAARNPEGRWFGDRPVDPAEKTDRVHDVFTSVARRYDLMNDLMSGGIHRLWKSAFIDAIRPRPGETLLDVAGGTGDIAFRFLDRTGPTGKALICDLTEGMVAVGRDRAIDRGRIAGIGHVVGNAESLPVADRSVDVYTISFGLRNVTRIDDALAEARRVLKPGGRFFCLEFSHVVIPLFGRIYDRYSQVAIPALGRWVARDEGSYRYLVESIRRFPDQAQLAARIEAAGLSRVKWRNLSGGIACIHSGWRI